MFRTAITLICNPARPCLDADLVAAVSRAVTTAGPGAVTPTVLKPGIAHDLLIDAPIVDAPAMTALVRAVTGDAPVDVVIQPTAHRRKTLLIADMDSTIIEQECLDELAGFAGLKDEIAAVTERAMRGELDFEEALIARVARLAGLSIEALEATFRDTISLTPGARALVQTMRAHGAFTALVSGGFTFFTERVAAATGFHTHRANHLIIENDTLAGTVAAPILGQAAKRDSLMAFASAHGVAPAASLAVGDGANDLAMIEAAGLGVAFHAKPAVAATADARIDHGDLTALLFLQGYTAREIIA